MSREGGRGPPVRADEDAIGPDDVLRIGLKTALPSLNLVWSPKNAITSVLI